MNDDATFLPSSQVDDRTVLPAARDDATFLPAQADRTTAALRPATQAAASVRLEPGDEILGGAYRVIEAVSGGMEADAYRGERIADGAAVFIKHQKRASNDARAWLLDKLKVTQHPGLLRLLDYELLERPIEVSEWLAGRSLSEILLATERFSDEEIAELARQLGEAVHHLHQAVGVAHRDIKPENILVVGDESPRYVLVDYGIMTMVDSGGYTNFAGTRKYAAPESRMRGLERKDFLPYDWWSVGRVLQELADGVHPYDRVRLLFPDRARDAEAVAVEWDKILFEDDPSVYGRAGQVEFGTNARWFPLLRGLLTSDRSKRWGYEQYVLALSGERPQDFYDNYAAQRAVFASADGLDVTAEILKLSQQAQWDEAVGQVLENRGIYRYAKGELGNKRVVARLAIADRIHDYLTKKSFQTATVEDLTTMLALKAIGGESVPWSLGGFVLSEETLVARAGREVSAIADLFSALAQAEIAEAIAELDVAASEIVRSFTARWLPVYRLLKKWNAHEDTLRMYPRMVLCAFQTRAENDTLITQAQKLFVQSEDDAINTAFLNPKRSNDEAAALAFLLPSAEKWNFITHETVSKRAAEKLAERALGLRRAYAWTVVRENASRFGFLFGHSGPIVLAGVCILPTAFLMNSIASFGAFIYLVAAAGFAWGATRIAAKNQQVGGCLTLVAIFTGVSAIISLVIAEQSVFGLSAILGVAAYFVIRSLRDRWIRMMQTYLKEETDGGWFKGFPQIATIDKYIADFAPGPRRSLGALRGEIADLNTQIAACPAEWGFSSGSPGGDEAVDAARTMIFVATGGFAALSVVLGIVAAVAGFSVALTRKLFGHH